MSDRLVGESRAIQRRIEKVARSIAGKHSPGAIAAMRGRRQSHNQHPRPGIAEARHRLAPVGLLTKSTAFFLRYGRAILSQARTLLTRHHRRVDLRQCSE